MEIWKYKQTIVFGWEAKRNLDYKVPSFIILGFDSKEHYPIFKDEKNKQYKKACDKLSTEKQFLQVIIK